METINDNLIEVLKLLKINEENYYSSIISSQITHYTIMTILSFIMLVIFIKAIIWLNKEIALKENIQVVCNWIKDYKGRNIPSHNKNIDSEEINETFSKENVWEYLKFLWKLFVIKLTSTTLAKHLICIYLLWKEIIFCYQLTISFINNVIMLINCFYSEDKVFLDYILNLI